MEILIGILCAYICGEMAKKRNRSVVGWVIAGFFFSIFAIILLYLLGKYVEP